ncbi:MAG: HD domain-containing phosphohydrolase [Thermodesulfobacteriota bacterium]
MFNLKFIKWLVALAVFGVMLLPIYVVFYLSPSLERYVAEETESHTVQVANYLSSELFDSAEASHLTLPDNIDQIVNDASSDFKLLEVKLFSALGEVVYSTNREDVGKINRNDYFQKIVASGKKFSKVVQKETASLEGQMFRADVVETYVPLMQNGKFIGAFEIYSDITDQVGILHGLTTGFYRTILPIALSLLLAIFFVLSRFRDNFIQRLTVEKKLREKEQRYRILFEQSNDAIMVFDRQAQIKQANEQACRLLGVEHSRLIGVNVKEFLDEDNQGEWLVAIGKVLAGENSCFDSHFANIDGVLMDVEVRAGLTGRKKDLVQAIIRDVSEQKSNQLAVKRGYQTQTILNKLLHLSLEDLTLIETLELFIYHLTSFPWLELEPKGAIFLVSAKPGILELKAHRGLNENLQTICAEVPFGQCLCGRCASSEEVVFADCVDDRHDNRYDGIGPHGHYCVPILSANRRLVGVFTLYVRPGTIRDKLAEETLKAAASVVAGVIQRKNAEEELQKSRSELEIRVQERTVELNEVNLSLGQELIERKEAERALAFAIEEKDDLIVNLFEIMYEMLANRDHSTFEHALRVAEISRRVGLELGLSAEDMETLRLGCLVHDIGKVAIPDDVLLKPGMFDRMDHNIMKVHPLVGASLFAKHHHDFRIRKIILHHHERLDGSGYPYGLKGEEIGALERIVAAADVFEALVARRPYKKPVSREKAVGIIRYEVKEGRLDHSIVELIAKITEEWSPLEVVSEFRADYSEDLEVFRQMSYFREPLSDFYNYRYLLYLDAAKMLAQSSNLPYHLIVASFPGIREFNKSIGFIKADQILDEIGHKLHLTAEEFDGIGDLKETSIILLRKSSDFLIYAECDDELLEKLICDVERHLEESKQDWGLNSRYHHFKFDHGYPAEQAINQVFSVH